MLRRVRRPAVFEPSVACREAAFRLTLRWVTDQCGAVADQVVLIRGRAQHATWSKMGIIRRTASISTLGMINGQSAKKRTAKYTKQTRNAARAQVAQQAVSLELQRKQLAALDHANVREELRPQAVQPNWYADPGNPFVLRWHDGAQWTAHTHRINTPPPPPTGY